MVTLTPAVEAFAAAAPDEAPPSAETSSKTDGETEIRDQIFIDIDVKEVSKSFSSVDQQAHLG